MAEKTGIEWTRGDDGSPGATWNPITGCSVVSPGCTNCYAMKLAGTRLQHHPSRAGLTRDSKAGPVWTGDVRLNEQWLDQPLRWKRPRRIFVCAHGDLFHESVPDEWIDRVFAIMAAAPHHTFQVLTKRAARMRNYIAAASRHPINGGWPLPNVWLGVSAEDQPRADERIPDLLATPAAVRFLSAEPLLGAVDLTRIPASPDADHPSRAFITWDALRGFSTINHAVFGGGGFAPGKLDWVIAGGESGPGARPMHPDWARSLRDQCAAAGTAFFFKQWGEWMPEAAALRAVWEPQVHDWHDGAISVRVGKKAAGRLLDGVEHNGMPPSAKQHDQGAE